MSLSGIFSVLARSSRRSLLSRRVFIAVLLAVVLSCSTHTPPPEQIVNLRDNILDAYGGKPAISQIQSIAAEGSITAIVRGDHGTYRRAWRKDGKLYVDIQYTKSRETRILNETRALRSVDGKLEEVSGPSAAAMIYQYNELSMPFALLDDSFEIQNRGMELAEGGEARVLRCTDRAGNSIDLFVNETTHRIVKTRGNFTVGGKPATLSSEYSNFRFIHGVLLPLKIVNYSGETRISEIVIDDYQLNGPLSDALFNPHTHGLKQ